MNIGLSDNQTQHNSCNHGLIAQAEKRTLGKQRTLSKSYSLKRWCVLLFDVSLRKYLRKIKQFD